MTTATPPSTDAGEDWRDIADAPRDGTVFLALYRDNGDLVYALTHYRTNRDETEGWWDGVVPSSKPPVFWLPLPAPPTARE